jgi:hypothetical protein
MNERIRELVRQAVISVDIVTGNEALDDELAKMYIPDCFSEKFAELIVRECRDIVSATRDQAIEDEWNVDEAMSTAMYDIDHILELKNDALYKHK